MGQKIKKRCSLGPLPGLLLVGAALAMLVGCETVANPTPPEHSYQPPPRGAAVALVKGSTIDEGGLFGSQHRGFVTMVDLQSIPNAAEHGSEPVAVAPGKRSIGVEYRYSNFLARAYVPLDAKAGATYQVKFKTGHEATPEMRLYVDFWMVDAATGNPVTAAYRRQATGGKTGTIFFQTK